MSSFVVKFCLQPYKRMMVGGCLICLASTCHQPNPTPTTTPTTTPAPMQRPPPIAKLAQPPPKASTSYSEKQSERWLYAERFVAGTTNGFVEGDFSAHRNRLIIKTHDVTRFAVDTRYISINWDKLVVIRINGHNSELKRRDDPVLHFVLDKHHQWVVDE